MPVKEAGNPALEANAGTEWEYPAGSEDVETGIFFYWKGRPESLVL